MSRHATLEGPDEKHWRSSIPRDIYQRVLQYALDMVNASGRNDTIAGKAAYRRLRRYWRAQEAKGRFHPFIPETVADFTDRVASRVKLYHHALRLARRMHEQEHTILLALGEQYLQSGNVRAARRCLIAAEADAIRHRDREDARSARKLLKQAPPNKEFERTRSTQTAVGPRRSIQCWAGH